MLICYYYSPLSVLFIRLMSILYIKNWKLFWFNWLIALFGSGCNINDRHILDVNYFPCYSIISRCIFSIYSSNSWFYSTSNSYSLMDPIIGRIFEDINGAEMILLVLYRLLLVYYWINPLIGGYCISLIKLFSIIIPLFAEYFILLY